MVKNNLYLHIQVTYTFTLQYRKQTLTQKGLIKFQSKNNDYIEVILSDKGKKLTLKLF